jgi:replication factor C subunit 3/5
MSDFEDDMDVDAPAVHDTVMFSSDTTTKGKRSAANLPVEAEDSLPWYAFIAFICFGTI